MGAEPHILIGSPRILRLHGWLCWALGVARPPHVVCYDPGLVCTSESWPAVHLAALQLALVDQPVHTRTAREAIMGRTTALLWTSGSTGGLKCIAITNRMVCAQAAAVATEYGRRLTARAAPSEHGGSLQGWVSLHYFINSALWYSHMPIDPTACCL